MFNDVHNMSLNKLRKVSLNNMLFNKIFESMDLYIYKDLCNVAKFNLDYESIRYNLFALTVAVFYQCKFLIQMEEVNVSD